MPRSVTAPASGHNWQQQAYSPTLSAGPAPPTVFSGHQTGYNNYQQSSYQQQAPQSYYPSQPTPDPYAQTPSQIRNPFAPPTASVPGAAAREAAASQYDPDLEAQYAQWQSAYASKDEQQHSWKSKLGGSGRGEGAASAGGANTTPLGARPNAKTPMTNSQLSTAANADTDVAAVVAGKDGKQKTVIRSGGGSTWQDPSLLEWDQAHFRIFVGNLAGEVTDESLLKAFVKYGSVQKARVVRDKRTTKSKGYGFVSFSNGDDYFQAAKDMQGKYIGSHPVLIKRSTTEIKATAPPDRRKKHGKGGKGSKGGGGGSNGANSHKADTGAGVQKKQSKTKGGLKLLG